MIAKNRYILPIEEALIQRIDRYSSPVHIGKLRNAIDFLAPINTPVYASCDGMVIYTKDDSEIGGPNPSYWNYSNFITIQHKNGEFSRYDHLAKNSSKVNFGQSVKSGQQIGNIGLTGYTFLPHLHFQVFIFTGYNLWADYETIEVKHFENSSNPFSKH